MATNTTLSEPPQTSWWVRHYTFTGTATGLVFIWLSLTPSLLPRGPLFQGLVSGASGAVGYGLGVFAVFLVRYMRSADSSPAAPRWAWAVLIPVAIAIHVLVVLQFRGWQRQVREMMGVPQLVWYAFFIAAALAVLILFVFVECGQLTRKAFRTSTRALNRVAPPRVSLVVVLALMVGLTIALLNGVVAKVAMRTMNHTFARIDDEVDPSLPAPTTQLRSGGPTSLVPWKSLGREGRRFVANGPSMKELTAFNGAPATEPIRAYAGLHSAHGIKATAELAALDLVRAGGLTRSIVAVGTTTGTGWINEAQATALEYMYNGDSAIVSMQYSFLPSSLSFLVDKENARQAGQALFEAVDKQIRALPESHRPKLVVFGESLGSFGGEAPFMTLDNVLARTDGALFSGPTFNNTIWDELTINRDPGSPQWLPIYNDGRNVRFVDRPSDLQRPHPQWDGSPRVVYLQHASDPIAWWNLKLLLKKPDWLSEPRGYDVLPSVKWKPIVTFLQVAADMAVAVDVPDGHGHSYFADIANAWAQILRPPGWTDEKTERLRPLMHGD